MITSTVIIGWYFLVMIGQATMPFMGGPFSSREECWRVENQYHVSGNESTGCFQMSVNLQIAEGDDNNAAQGYPTILQREDFSSEAKR